MDHGKMVYRDDEPYEDRMLRERVDLICMGAMACMLAILVAVKLWGLK